MTTTAALATTPDGRLAAMLTDAQLAEATYQARRTWLHYRTDENAQVHARFDAESARRLDLAQKKFEVADLEVDQAARVRQATALSHRDGRATDTDLARARKAEDTAIARAATARRKWDRALRDRARASS